MSFLKLFAKGQVLDGIQVVYAYSPHLMYDI